MTRYFTMIFVIAFMFTIKMSLQRPAGSLFQGRPMDFAWKNEKGTHGEKFNEKFRHGFSGKFIGAGDLGFLMESNEDLNTNAIENGNNNENYRPNMGARFMGAGDLQSSLYQQPFDTENYFKYFNPNDNE